MDRLRTFLILLTAALLTLGTGKALRAAPVVGEDEVYVVADGDDMPGIAHRHGLAMEHIAFANGLHLDQYVPDVDTGVSLWIPSRRILPDNPPRDGIVLNIPERGLYLFRHGHFVKFYPVAVGRPGFETPRGSFYIIEKIKNPSWAPPVWAKMGEIVMPPGPKNPLGDRWIGLSAHGVGIHGTCSPDAIGMDVSHGCIRMYPDLERELYTQVSPGMPVRIEYQPVKLGYDSQHRAFLAVFPDVYHLVDVQARALALVRQAGLRIPRRRVEAIVNLHTGRVTDLAHDPMVVRVDDRDLPLTAAPRRIGNVLYVPMAALPAAGIACKAEGNGYVLQHGTQKVRLQVTDGAPDDALAPPPGTLAVADAGRTGDDPVVTAWRSHGQTMVPATTVLHDLGLRYEWRPAVSTLWIKTADGAAESTP